jgi:hypothetical protein
VLVFGAFVLGVILRIEWVSPRISLRETWMDV